MYVALFWSQIRVSLCQTNLELKHDKYLEELVKSPLVQNQAEIVENYDIFLNCIYWQVKGLRGRSATRRAASGCTNSDLFM